jgi:dTMP kinase
VGRIATGGQLPDCIFLLDMALGDADRRLKRPLDRMENQGDAYRKRLQEGFRAEIMHWGNRIHVIDASRPIDAVQADIWRVAAGKLEIAEGVRKLRHRQ